MKATLVYPPLSDPTAGYLSLPYLASYVRSMRDYEITIIDANIEALIFNSQPEYVNKLLDKATEKFRRLSSKRTLPENQKLRLYDLLLCKDIEATGPSEAINIFRSPQHFWDYAEYYDAAVMLMKWLRLLSIDGVPGYFDKFTLSDQSPLNLFNLQSLLSDALESASIPFRDYIKTCFIPQLLSLKPTVVGLGVTYQSQLPFALYIAKEIKKSLSSKIIIGGTEITQLWKYSVNQTIKRLLELVDALVIGEGESAIVELLDTYAFGKHQTTSKNILTASSLKHGTIPIPKYESLSRLPTPDFSDLPWEKYFSPMKMVYYAPTRGCYWDKCAFCDYGLASDRPTSPWRMRPLEYVIEDLTKISEFAEYVYFSVDVVSPSYLIKLANCLIDNNIRIKWGTELRLEENYTKAICELLAESGCIGISAGLESGNQRVLDLMRKGIKVDDIREVICNFAAAEIGVQVMSFTGFPSGNFKEAMDTIRILKELKGKWTFGGLGNFVLTAGSIVAKNPDKFEIKSLKPRDEDDIQCLLEYEEKYPPKSAIEIKNLQREIDKLTHPNELPRPFVGGVDTAHSYFYLSKFGASTAQQLDKAFKPLDLNLPIKFKGLIMTDLTMSKNRSNKDENNSYQTNRPILLENGRLIESSDLIEELIQLLDGRFSLPELLGVLLTDSKEKNTSYILLLSRLIELGLVKN